jgi:hypothetical protein
MTISEVQICNLALARIGQSVLISSMDEASPAASMCNLFYSTCRDRILESYPWRFATKYVELQDIGGPPSNWAYRYRYPNDCLAARSIVCPGMRNQTIENRITFSITEDSAGNGRAICCDISPVELEYTAKITMPSLFSPEFSNALAWLLASDICLPLTGDANNIKLYLQMYESTVASAFAASMREGQDGLPADSIFITQRLR